MFLRNSKHHHILLFTVHLDNAFIRYEFRISTRFYHFDSLFNIVIFSSFIINRIHVEYFL